MSSDLIDRQLSAIESIITEGEGISSIDFHSKRRYTNLVLARYIFMTLAVKCNNGTITYDQIAEYVGYNGISKHSLVCHAMKTIDNWIFSDKTIKYKVELYYEQISKMVITPVISAVCREELRYMELQ